MPMTPAQPTQKKPDPCSFVIFGVSGDLTHRLVIPSLYNLAATDLLPDKFCVVGVARKGMSNDALRDSLIKGLRQFATRPVDDAIAKRLLECVTCVEADPKDPASFDQLRERLEKLETNRSIGGNRLFYLATPPDAFAPISRELGRTGLLREEDKGASRRVVVEKPFGTHLASAKALNAELLKIVNEHQIYRIDHYLGKETVQNILVLRFANGMFEPIWNRNHIDHVQIIVDEQLGVGHRGSFYASTGALRDMVPNHLFQLLSLVGMEPPIRFDAHSVRSEKGEGLAAIQIQSEEETQHHRNLCGAQTDDRQLALGRRSLLSAHRQGAREQAHRSGDQVQAGAVRNVQVHPGRSFVAELSCHQHRADRGHHAAVQYQGAGAHDYHRRCRDEIPLQGLLQGCAEHRIRDPD